MEEAKRLTAKHKAMYCGAGTEVLVQAAEPSDPLREKLARKHPAPRVKSPRGYWRKMPSTRKVVAVRRWRSMPR